MHDNRETELRFRILFTIFHAIDNRPPPYLHMNIPVKPLVHTYTHVGKKRLHETWTNMRTIMEEEEEEEYIFG